MIYEASFSGIIKILFWIFAVGFIIRLVAAMALPRVVKKAEERMQEHARRQQENARPPRPEGDVKVETDSRNRSGDQGGDYVDYVEIKD